jgi:hypothetical protein
MATLPARWLPFEWMGEGGDFNTLMPAVVRYVRASTGWRRTPTFYVQLSSSDPSRRESSVTSEEIAALAARGTRVETGEVVRQPVGTSDIKRESLASAWRQYLALEHNDLPFDAKPLPLPLSPEFWRRYREPLPAFLHAASTLRTTLSGLARQRPDMTDEAAREAAHAKTVLDALLAPVSPALMAPDRGPFQQNWVSTSLLATFAMQAYLDLTADGRILTCVCGRMFISSSKRVEYCSPPCRWRAHQRAYRAKKRAVHRDSSTSHRP